VAFLKKRLLPIGRGARVTTRARDLEASLMNDQPSAVNRCYSAAKRIVPSGKMFAKLNALPSRAIS
jgi:hypothetical protein